MVLSSDSFLRFFTHSFSSSDSFSFLFFSCPSCFSSQRLALALKSLERVQTVHTIQAVSSVFTWQQSPTIVTLSKLVSVLSFFSQTIHHNYKRQLSYLAPPEITPDFWKRVPSRATDWKKDNVVTVNIISIRRKTISINCSWLIKIFKTLHMCNINVWWERYSHLFKPDRVSSWTIKNQAFK